MSLKPSALHPTLPHCGKDLLMTHLLSSRSAIKKNFFHHIYSIEDFIQFTAEDTHADGTLPFLDVLVIPQPDGSLSTTVYRKPTHTGQYLQWDSHHAISAKYSVISTLFHMAKEVCSTKQHLVREQDHIKQALTVCKYPKWALNRAQKKTMAHKQSSNQNKGLRGNNNHPKRRTYITVPYIKGLGESVKNTCKKYGISSILQRRQNHQRPPEGTKRQRSHHSKKVASFTDISVIGWSVIRSIYVNQPEPLVKGLKSI